MKNRKFDWPEHSTWWDRNQRKVLLGLIILFFVLLSLTPLIVSIAIENLLIAFIWLITIVTDSFFMVILFPRSKDGP